MPDAAPPAPEPAPPEPAPVTLVVGPEDLLADRAVAAVVAAARAVDSDSDVRELRAPDLEPGGLAMLTSPSLFGGCTVLVVRDVQDLPAAVAGEMKARVGALPEGVHLVLVHGGGVKNKAVLEAARAAGAVAVDCPKVTRFGDVVAFVRAEVRLARRTITEDAARLLLDAVGRDLRDLAAACSQLMADVQGAIDEQAVRLYYAGRAEATSFSVADSAVEGRTADALEQLRWALSVGVAPVLVTSALAAGLRNIARVATAPRGLRPADLAGQLGMPPWKVDRVRQQVRGWTGDGVAAALQAVAFADAAVKGAGSDPAYALERAVVDVVRARARR